MDELDGMVSDVLSPPPDDATFTTPAPSGPAIAPPQMPDDVIEPPQISPMNPLDPYQTPAPAEGVQHVEPLDNMVKDVLQNESPQQQQEAPHPGTLKQWNPLDEWLNSKFDTPEGQKEIEDYRKRLPSASEQNTFDLAVQHMGREKGFQRAIADMSLDEVKKAGYDTKLARGPTREQKEARVEKSIGWLPSPVRSAIVGGAQAVDSIQAGLMRLGGYGDEAKELRSVSAESEEIDKKMQKDKGSSALMQWVNDRVRGASNAMTTAAVGGGGASTLALFGADAFQRGLDNAEEAGMGNTQKYVYASGEAAIAALTGSMMNRLGGAGALTSQTFKSMFLGNLRDIGAMNVFGKANAYIAGLKDEDLDLSSPEAIASTVAKMTRDVVADSLLFAGLHYVPSKFSKMMRENPEAAKALADKEFLSRGDLEQLGVNSKSSIEQRKKLQESMRKAFTEAPVDPGADVAGPMPNDVPQNAAGEVRPEVAPPAAQEIPAAEPTPAEEAPALEAKPPERRVDYLNRKRVSEMTEAEKGEALLTHELTGIKNGRAWNERQKRPIQYQLDIEGLKYFNDEVGKKLGVGDKAGDEVLKASATTLQKVVNEALKESGGEIFNTHGDTFVGDAATEEEYHATIAKAREHLKDAIVEVKLADGTIKRYKGIGIAAGKGASLEEAHADMEADKVRRVESGERAPRGERPRSLAEIPATGSKDSVNSPSEPRENVPRIGKGNVKYTGPVIKETAVGGNDSPGRRVEEQGPRASKVDGAETTIHDPTGRKAVKAKYALMEAADVVPSHDFTGQSPTPRKDYPQELQPRDYSPGSDGAAKVYRFANEKIADHYINNVKSADNGPSTVSPDGTVVAGNGRAMSLQSAAAKGDYEWYKSKLKTDAKIYGIDPAAVDGMKHPMLVRVIEGDTDSADAKHISAASNVSNTYSQNATREAAQMASIIPDSVMDELKNDPEGTFSKLVNDEKAGQSLRRALIKELPKSQVARYFDQRGMLTEDGKVFVESMFLAKVLPIETIDGMTPAMRRKVEAIVPQMVLMKRGEGENLTPAIKEALDFIAGPLEGGKIKLEDYESQGAFEFDKKKEISDEARGMIETLENKTARQLRDHFASEIKLAEEKNGLFGEEIKGVHGSPSLQVPKSMPAKVEGDLSNHEIVKQLERDFDIKVRLGKTVGKNLGQYHTFTELVRVQGKLAGDLAVVTHEVAHHIDKKFDVVKSIPTPFLAAEVGALDYTPQARPSEGFAEYLRHYLTDDKLPKLAPKFDKWFREDFLPQHPEIEAKLEDNRALIQKWRDQGAFNRADANMKNEKSAPEAPNVPLTERIKNRFAAAAERFYTAWKDEFQPTNAAVKEARSRGYNERKGEDPYHIQMYFTQTGPARANDAIDNGVARVTGKQDRIGKSLKEYIGDVKPEEYDDWIRWAWARHSIESWDKGVNPGMEIEDARHIFDAGKKNKHWEKAAEGLTQFNNDAIDMLRDAGVITHKVAQAIKDSYKTYLPLQRVTDTMQKQGLGGSKTVSVAEPLKRRKGSGLQIIDPVQATIDRMIHFYERAGQQQVQDAIVKMVEKTEGLGRIAQRVKPDMEKTTFTIEKVRQQLEAAGIDPAQFKNINPQDLLFVYSKDFTGKSGKPIARVIRNGEPHLYEFDPTLYRTLSGMDRFVLPTALGAISRVTTNLVKMAATGANPGFAAINMIRDYKNYIFNKKEARGVKSFVDPLLMTASYAKSELSRLAGNKGDPLIELWKSTGGEISTSLGLDQSSYKKKVGEVMADSNKQRVYNIVKHPIDALRHIIGVSEVGPRLAEFKAALKNRGYSIEDIRAGKVKVDRPDLVEAGNAAADVTLNFKRLGYIGKKFNQIIPFFNAPLEGTDKFIRTIKDDPKRAAIMSAAFIAPTVLYWLKHRDDDWYREQEPWLKQGFTTWTEKDLGLSGEAKPIIRIPKSEGPEGIIANGVEALLDAMYRKDPKKMTGYLTSVATQIAPNWKPAAVMPIVENAVNKDFFRGQPIVTDTMAKQEKPFQSSAYNTELSKKIGELIGQSPAMIEHLLDGYTAGAFSGVVKRGESVVLGKKTNDADTPVTGRFALRKDPSQSVNDFYAKRTEVEQKYTTEKDQKKLTPEIEQQYHRYERLGGIMADIKKLVADESDRDTRFAVEKYVTGLARLANGDEELERYPNPLAIKNKDLPPEVVKLKDKYLEHLVSTMASQMPQKVSKQEEHRKSVKQAMYEADNAGIDPAALKSAFYKWNMKEHQSEAGQDKALEQFMGKYSKLKKEKLSLATK